MMHDDTARAIARDTGWDLDRYAAERGWSGVSVGPVGQSRDSDALERSNMRVILEDLERFGDAVEVASFGHWAVGWVEEIAWDTGRPDVHMAVQGWRDRLAGYPVADEADWSDLEWETNHPTDRDCYSEDPDCPCRANRRAHLRALIARLAS